jgi:hypothetical protein
LSPAATDSPEAFFQHLPPRRRSSCNKTGFRNSA